MAKVYTISSGKGGVGKTFFSINLSRALSFIKF
ncbi:nucleotide-binding protein [Candidatus Nanopusillus massiliensis]